MNNEGNDGPETASGESDVECKKSDEKAAIL
jgi:hypothetical protein